MKPSTLHGIWGLIAVAAFAVGQWGSSGNGGLAGAGGPTEARTGGPQGASGRSGERSRTTDGSLAGKSGRRRSLDGGKGSRRVLSEVDIAALGEQIRKSPNPLERRLAFSQLLEGLTAENAELLREQIADLSDESSEFRDFHYAWGAIAGDEAVIHGSETRKTDMAVTLAGWASANPAGAMKWFDGLAQDADDQRKGWANQKHLMAGLVGGLGDADPNAATEFVLGMAAAEEKTAGWLLGIVAGKVLKAGSPAEAAGWAEGLPTGPMKTTAMGRVSYEYARNDPEGAVTWLESLPEGPERSRGMGTAFAAWARSDPMEAGEYINRMEKSPERDSAISSYASRIAWEDPVVGVEWANSVSDPAAREQALIRTGQVYYRRDAKAAREWLAGSGLSPAVQKKVLSASHRRR